MFSSVETSAGQTFPHSPMDIDYWEKLGNCVWEYLAHMEWRGVFRSYGMQGSTWLIWSVREYSDHTVCRGILGSYPV